MTDGLLGAGILNRHREEDRPASELECEGKLLRRCWARYEIENYFVHPATLARFVSNTLGEDAPLAEVGAVKEALQQFLPGLAIRNPLDDHDSLVALSARASVLEGFFDMAGMQGLEYSRYSGIAAIMRPEEIHPEISRVFDAIADHFNL